MEPEGSLPSPQQPATGPYPEPDESSPQLPTVSLRSILSLPSVLYLSGFPTKTLYAFIISPMRATWPVHLILLYLITLIIPDEAPHYAVSSSPLIISKHNFFVNKFNKNSDMGL